jgi:hypothetical protein
MIDALKAGAFLLLFAAGYLIIREHSETRRRKMVSGLLAYFSLLCLLPGVIDRDAWPFARYPLVPNRYHEEDLQRRLEYRGVDAHGVEHDISSDSFSPLFPLAVDRWFERYYHSLPEAAKRSAMHYLALRAEEARRRELAGQAIGPHRFLGPLAAPDWWRYAFVQPSREPFRALRIYRQLWRPAERWRNPNAVERTLVAEGTP